MKEGGSVQKVAKRNDRYIYKFMNRSVNVIPRVELSTQFCHKANISNTSEYIAEKHLKKLTFLLPVIYFSLF